MRRRAPLAPLPSGRARLPEATGHYLARVLRLARGDEVELFDAARGTCAIAQIEHVDGSLVDVVVGAHRAAPRPEGAEWVVVQGLCKGDKIDAVVEDATELGAAEIVIAECTRSVVRLDVQRSVARRERWTKIASAAARQSMAAHAPSIAGPLPLAEALSTAGDLKILLDPSGLVTLGAALAGLREARRVVLAIGPEGGFDDSERALAESLGFTIARFGATVLRAETVTAAVLGALRVLSEG